MSYKFNCPGSPLFLMYDYVGVTLGFEWTAIFPISAAFKKYLEYFTSFFLKLVCREIEYFIGFIGFITIDTALFAYLSTK